MTKRRTYYNLRDMPYNKPKRYPFENYMGLRGSVVYATKSYGGKFTLNLKTKPDGTKYCRVERIKMDC